MDVVKGRLGGFQRDEIRHLPVHPRRPQRTPERYHKRAPVVNAQFAFRFRLGAREEAAPDGRPRHNHFLRMFVVLPAGLKAHHNPVYDGLQ